MRRLRYEAPSDLVRDAVRLALTDSVDTLGGELTKTATGWSMQLMAGFFLPLAEHNPPVLPADLQFTNEEVVRMSYAAPAVQQLDEADGRVSSLRS